MRNDWTSDVSGEYIVKRLIWFRELFTKIMEKPEILDAYLRYRVLTDLAEGGIYKECAGAQAGIEIDENEILRPLLKNLDDKAYRHFVDADWEENIYEATVPLWNVFQEKLLDVRVEEVEV